MLQKAVLLEIWRSHYLTGVAVLPSTVCNDSENELLAEFLRGALKVTENFQEITSDGFQQLRSSTIQFCWNSLASATYICQW